MHRFVSLLSAVLVLPLALAASAFADDAPDEMAHLRACRSNQIMLEVSAENLPDFAERAKAGSLSVELLKEKGVLVTENPLCPKGGVYAVAALPAEKGGKPAGNCSFHGDVKAIHARMGAIEAEEFEAQLARDRANPPTEAQIVAEADAKRCAANLNLLAGAAGLYRILHKEATAVTQSDMKREGVLLSDPACPAGGAYSIDLSGEKPSASCAKHGGTKR